MTFDARPPRRVAFLVCGPHRSGTSAMARVLSLAGLGELPADVLPPHPSHNPTGFWESRSVVELNDALLHEQGGAWDAPPDPRPASADDVARIGRLVSHQWSGGDRLVVKDPRISLLLPAWREALGGLGYHTLAVVMLRPPLEAAASLVARDGLPADQALAIWTRYLARAAGETEAPDRVLVAFEALLGDWRAVVRSLVEASGREPVELSAAQAGAIDAFLDPALRRTRPVGELTGTGGQKEATALYARLLAARRTRPTAPGVPAPVSPRWLLLTGPPCSGTARLRALLNDHPEVGVLAGYGLTALLGRLDALLAPPAREPEATGSEARSTAPPLGQFDDLARSLFAGVFQGKALRVLGDEAPISEPWEDLPLLLERLPGLRIVAVVRNPADVVRSALAQAAARSSHDGQTPAARAQDAVARWILAWRALGKIRSRHGDRLLLVKYEELLAQPAETLAEVFAALGLAPHVATLAPPKAESEAPHADVAQAVTERLLGAIIEAWPKRDAESLMSEFRALTPPYRPGEKLHLASEESGPYLALGFSFAEDWGRWTDGPHARVLLPHGEARGLLLVEIEIARAFVPSDGACRLVVRCGWGEPKLFTLGPDRQNVAFVTFAEETDTAGQLAIDLVVARPKAPDEPPADSRALGIGVEWIRATRLPDRDGGP